MTVSNVGNTQGFFNIGPNPSGSQTSVPLAPTPTPLPVESGMLPAVNPTTAVRLGDSTPLPQLTSGTTPGINASALANTSRPGDALALALPATPGSTITTSDGARHIAVNGSWVREDSVQSNDPLAPASGVPSSPSPAASTLIPVVGLVVQPVTEGERQEIAGRHVVAVPSSSGSGLMWVTADSFDAQPLPDLRRDSRVEVRNNDLYVNGRRLDLTQANALFAREFRDAFAPGFLQNGWLNASTPAPGGNGATWVSQNRYGLDLEATETLANFLRQLNPSWANTTVVARERDNTRSFDEFFLQVPGFAAPVAAGDLALMLMRPNQNQTDARTAVGSLNASNVGGTLNFLSGAFTLQATSFGSYTAPLTAGGNSGLFQVNDQTWIFGPGGNGNQFFGVGQTGVRSVQAAFPSLPADQWAWTGRA